MKTVYKFWIHNDPIHPKSDTDLDPNTITSPQKWKKWINYFMAVSKFSDWNIREFKGDDCFAAFLNFEIPIGYAH